MWRIWNVVWVVVKIYWQNIWYNNCAEIIPKHPISHSERSPIPPFRSACRKHRHHRPGVFRNPGSSSVWWVHCRGGGERLVAGPHAVWCSSWLGLGPPLSPSTCWPLPCRPLHEQDYAGRKDERAKREGGRERERECEISTCHKVQGTYHKHLPQVQGTYHNTKNYHCYHHFLGGKPTTKTKCEKILNIKISPKKVWPENSPKYYGILWKNTLSPADHLAHLTLR